MAEWNHFELLDTLVERDKEIFRLDKANSSLIKEVQKRFDENAKLRAKIKELEDDKRERMMMSDRLG